MIFAQKVLAPGPGTRSMATFRWCPFQSAFRNLQCAIPMARRVHEMGAAMIFAQKVLAPGPGTQRRATFRRGPIPSA